MHPPIFVRKPSAEERTRLEAGLRVSDAFTVRRAQIVLLSAEGRRPREIARGLRCAVQTARATASAPSTPTAWRASWPPHRGRRVLPRCWARWSGSGCGRSCTSRHAALAMPGAPGHWRFLAGGGAGGWAERLRAVHRDHPPSAAPPGRRLEAGQGLDRHPDPAYAQNPAARPADPPGPGSTGLGARLRGRDLVDPRFAHPALHAWAAPDQPSPCHACRRSRGPRGRKRCPAMACGCRARPRMLLRFVAGRPVSPVTDDFLAWVSERLAAEGMRWLSLVWDNAAWHAAARSVAGSGATTVGSSVTAAAAC